MDPINSSSINGTNEVYNELFSKLDIFLPGFSGSTRLVSTYLGIDLSLYLPLIAVICGLTAAWTYMRNTFSGLVDTYLMSSIRIRTDDEIYNMLIFWVVAQKFSQNNRRVIASTTINSKSSLIDYNSESDDEEDDYNLAQKRKRQKMLQYTPTYGTHWFWYKGRPLFFERSEMAKSSPALVAAEKEEFIISCYGRDPAILKDLLDTAREAYSKKDEKKTIIYRAQLNARYDAWWRRSMSRSSRPLSTVILSDKVKQELVDDIADYLSPGTRKWYANRGIPYRRGYLLYGPPGTGKSSLSLALAGHFNLPIFIMSLTSPQATEENVSTLFDKLPRHCVILLEDIDAAGLTLSREAIEGDDDAADAPADEVIATGGAQISLSGLLNVLDGVASQEGRVLVMTTNHLERLDKALIRPGRVDMIIKYGLADADTTAGVFRAVYAPYSGEETLEIEKSSGAGGMSVEKVKAEIDALAKVFADKIPPDEFSPAEIQGLLLRHKRDPQGAIDSIDSWVQEARREQRVRKDKEAKKNAQEAAKRAEAAQKKKQKAEKQERQAEKRARREAQLKQKEEAEAEKKESEAKAEPTTNGVDSEPEPVTNGVKAAT